MDGRRLNDEFEKGVDLSPLAETWEGSTHPDDPSYMICRECDVQELVTVLKQHHEYLGELHKGEPELPILMKIIYAKNISVQVHPIDG